MVTCYFGPDDEETDQRLSGWPKLLSSEETGDAVVVQLALLTLIDIILILLILYIYYKICNIKKILNGILTAASVNHRIRRALEKASQRPRRRYITFAVETTERIEERDLAKAIIELAREVLGDSGLVDSGLHLVYYDPILRLGVLRVRHTYKYHALAILGLVRNINDTKVRLIPLGTSGTLKRALKRIGARKK